MLTPNQQKWLDALRSGRFKQGQGALRRGEKHCCLGVACEVAIENGAPVTREMGIITSGLVAYVSMPLRSTSRRHDASSTVPPAVEEFFGLARHYTRLANLNDEGYSFEQIADELEARPEKYFDN